MQMRTSLHMDGYIVCTCLCKRFEMPLRFFDHQMYVKWKFRHALTGFDDDRSHSDVRDEVTVHHVYVKPIRARGFARGDLFAEARKICREDGGGEDVFCHYALVGVPAAEDGGESYI